MLIDDSLVVILCVKSQIVHVSFSSIQVYFFWYWILVDLYACFIYLFARLSGFIFLHLYYWLIVCISYDILTYLILHVFIISCDMIDYVIACLNIHILHWLLIVACCNIFTFAISIFDVWHYVFTWSTLWGLVFSDRFCIAFHIYVLSKLTVCKLRNLS